MAKRAPKDEKPYRPLEESLVKELLGHSSASPPTEQPAFVTSHAPESATREVAVLPPPALAPPVLPREEPRPQARVMEFPQLPPRHLDEPRAPAVAPAARSQVQTAEPEHRLSREKRVLLTEAEEDAIEALVARVARELGTTVKLSHLLRASIALLLHGEESIIERAKRTGRLKRPPNNDPMALFQYEHTIARIIDSAFKNAPPIK